jgi:hypothetical protein
MKKIIQLITMTTAFWGMASLRAAESWEGSDDFTSSANSANLWKKVVDRPTKGRAFVEGGEVRYSATGDASDAAWAWGKRGHSIPSSASWLVECTVRLPTTAPLGVDFTKGGMFIASTSLGRGAYRALTFKAYQRYDTNQGIADGFPYAMAEYDYSRGGELEAELPLNSSYPTLRLVFRHDALTQTDTYQIKDGGSGDVLAEEEYRSGLAADPNVAVGFLLAGKPKWSGSSLAVDDWSVAAFTPDAITLPALTKAGSTIGGSAWTLTIQNLRLVKAARGGGYSAQATGSLAFGGTTLSIPVTGTIQKDGTFLLTGRGAKGTAANGYGFTIRYDTYASVVITGKNSVTAPKQKAIKF